MRRQKLKVSLDTGCYSEDLWRGSKQLPFDQVWRTYGLNHVENKVNNLGLSWAKLSSNWNLKLDFDLILYLLHQIGIIDTLTVPTNEHE